MTDLSVLCCVDHDLLELTQVVYSQMLRYVTENVLYTSCTGNSNTTSLPVNFLYTPLKVSTFHSVLFLSLGSRYTCTMHIPYRSALQRLMCCPSMRTCCYVCHSNIVKPAILSAIYIKAQGFAAVPTQMHAAGSTQYYSIPCC